MVANAKVLKDRIVRPKTIAGLAALLLVVIFVATKWYVGDKDGLYLVWMDGSRSPRIAGADASFYGWIDNKLILIRRGQELRALDVDRGESELIAADQLVNVQLSPDRGQVAYLALRGESGGWMAGLHVVKVDGTDHRTLVEAHGLHSFSWSPDSEHVIYFIDPMGGANVIHVSAREPARYLNKGGAWYPCDRILFVEEENVYSVRPDGSDQTLLGRGGAMQCSPDGTMLTVERVERPASPPSIELFAIDGSGSRGILTTGHMAGWSPDGSKLAVYRQEWRKNLGEKVERELVIVDVQTGEEVPLLVTEAESGSCWSVCWSPDSRWVAFSAGDVRDVVRDEEVSTGSRQDMYLVRVDGTDLRRLASPLRSDYGCGWSPDGTRMVVRSESGAIRFPEDH